MFQRFKQLASFCLSMGLRDKLCQERLKNTKTTTELARVLLSYTFFQRDKSGHAAATYPWSECYFYMGGVSIRKRNAQLSFISLGRCKALSILGLSCNKLACISSGHVTLLCIWSTSIPKATKRTEKTNFLRKTPSFVWLVWDLRIGAS